MERAGVFGVAFWSRGALAGRRRPLLFTHGEMTPAEGAAQARLFPLAQACPLDGPPLFLNLDFFLNRTKVLFSLGFCGWHKGDLGSVEGAFRVLWG